MGNTPDANLRSFATEANLNIPFKNKFITRCSKCCHEFAIFRSGRKCRVCLHSFCTQCITPTENGDLCFCCKYCGIPGREPNSEELLKERPQDLLWILKHNGISSIGLIEKDEIVAEIIKQYRIHPRNRAYWDRHRQGQAAQPRPSPSRPSRQTNRQTASSSSSNRVNSHNAQTSRHYTAPHIPPPTYADFVGNQREHSEPPPSCSRQSQQPKINRVRLQDITNSSEIDNLNIKQLKDILSFNMVNYTGCCERPDLVSRVQALWSSHKQEIKRSEEASTAEKETPDTHRHAESDPGCEISTKDNQSQVPKKNADLDACKICLDNEANTAFLHCGHMVACVDCARTLSECPICRQIIVKCIRIFRS